MLSINMLMGLISVTAHHSTLLTSRSLRLDCSLALGPGPADSGSVVTSMQQNPPNHLSSFCPSWTIWASSAPSPQMFLGFTVKMCQTPSNNKRKREEMLWHSPASSFPLCCTSTVEGWHQDRTGEVLGERCACSQGGQKTSSELVSSRLHQWNCLEKQLLLQKSNF